MYAQVTTSEEKGKEFQLLSSKNEESIQCVETIMRIANEEKRIVFKGVEDFNTGHFEVRKKLNKVKSSYSDNYLNTIAKERLTPMVVYLSSEQGLTNLWKKIAVAHTATKKYEDFITATFNYGRTPKQFLEGIGFKNRLMK